MSYDLRGAWESVTGHHTTTHADPDDTPENQKLSVVRSGIFFNHSPEK